MCFNGDGPGCSCFDDSGAWEPSGDWINDIARMTLGTRDSCSEASNRGSCGKPYYQFVLGMDTYLDALEMSWAAEAFGLGDSREAWCSETVAYWHRRAGIPYPRGYRNDDWHLSWQLTWVRPFHVFYQTEELRDEGRGIWIEHSDIDYENFLPGVTVPLPGSYVLVQKRDIATERWLSGTHSMLIDEMVVHTDDSEGVQRVSFTVIEGNGQGEFVGTRSYEDILQHTPAGGVPLAQGGNVFIRGFGVDLDASGYPVYDPERFFPVGSYAPPENALSAARGVGTAPDPLAYLLKEYSDALRETSGEHIDCTHPNVTGTDAGIPNGRDTSWVIPAGLPGRVRIEVDLIATHPLKIRGLYLKWSDEGIPPDLLVTRAGEDREFTRGQLPDLDPVPFGTPLVCYRPWPAVIPVPVRFGTGVQGESLRYLRIWLTPDPSHEYELEEIGFFYRWPVVSQDKGITQVMDATDEPYLLVPVKP